MDKDIRIFTVASGQHYGMSLVSLFLMEAALKSGTEKVVYVNFELPKIAKETIGKYATIKKILAP